MALIVSREGDVQLLTDLLGGGKLETWLLCLYSHPIIPSDENPADIYLCHEANFVGYARKVLIRCIGRNFWNRPVLASPSGDPPWTSRSRVGHSQYGDKPQSWTCGDDHGHTIYGYFILGASSGKLICSEAFEHPRTLYRGDTLSITPVFENA